MSFFSPNCEWEQNRAFFFPPDEPDELLAHLEEVSDELAMLMFKWIMQKKIDVVISQNACALPAHLSMGFAIKKLVEKTGVSIICHDHDFYWERGSRYHTPFPEVEKMIDESFPLQIPHAKHAVINSYSQNYLKEKYNIDSVMVPNVMDFDEPYGLLDEYNYDLRESIGLAGDDIALFQVTRIVRRKGIETALELIEKIDDPKVKLVVTGSAADDEGKGYYKELVEIIAQKKLGDRVIFAEHRILNDRGKTKTGDKIYSLSDAYAHASACTYFSRYEGFGNAFVEAVLARQPIFVNNYKPIYWPDIGSKGFKTVMIEDNVLTESAVSEMKEIIYNDDLQRDIAEYNFELGKQYFSYDVLREKLKFLLNQL